MPKETGETKETRSQRIHPAQTLEVQPQPPKQRRGKAHGYRNRREQLVATRYGSVDKNPIMTVEDYVKFIGLPAVIVGGLTAFLGGRAFSRKKSDWDKVFKKFNEQG